MPTSTPNVREGCHPYSTKDYFENNYILVHNGVVRNTETLQAEHKKLGIDYVSLQETGRFNDSEALAYDIARYLEGEKTYITAAGSIAFIAIKRDKAGKPMTLFFGRNNGNPLRMKKTKFSLTLSSEGEGELIEANYIYSFSYDTYELTRRECTIPSGWSPSPYSRPTTYGANSGFHAPQSSSIYSGTAPKAPNSEDSLENISKSWEDNELLDEDDYKFATQSEVKNVIDFLLHEANYSTQLAIGLGQELLKDLEMKQMKLQYMSEDEELEGQMTPEEINEFVGIEDDIVYHEQALIELKRKLTEEVVKEEVARKPIGFRPAPTPTTPKATTIETGVRHPVPTRPPTTKAIGTGVPYAD